MSMIQNNDEMLRSGLMNLVEAATALTELVREVRVAKTNQSDHLEVQAISDDDDGSGQSQYLHEVLISDLACSTTSLSTSVDSSREIFPQRLMQLLADTSISDIIRWLPHGKSFMILRPEVFTEKILPLYFPESRAVASTKSKDSSSSSTTYKYPSFTRKLNRWGFRQVTKGADAGAFHHKFFKRCEPDLCLRMICQKSRRPKVADNHAQGHDTSFTSPPKDRTTRVNHSRPENTRQVTDSESVTSGSRASQDESRKKRKLDNVDTHNSQTSSFPVPIVISNLSSLPPKLLTLPGANTSASYVIPSAIKAASDNFKSSSSFTSKMDEPSKMLLSVLNAHSCAQGESKTSEKQVILNGNFDLKSSIDRPLIPGNAVAVAYGEKYKKTEPIMSEAHIRAEKAKVMLYQAYIEALSL